jgi:hypothetical protein
MDQNCYGVYLLDTECMQILYDSKLKTQNTKLHRKSERF